MRAALKRALPHGMAAKTHIACQTRENTDTPGWRGMDSVSADICNSFHAKNGLSECGMVRFLGVWRYCPNQWEAQANPGDGQKASALRSIHDIPLRAPNRLRYESADRVGGESAREKVVRRPWTHFGSPVRLLIPSHLIQPSTNFSLRPRSATGQSASLTRGYK